MRNKEKNDTGSRRTKPVNAMTLTPYQGRNIVRLTKASRQCGYDDPRWISRRQAEAQGWRIHEGEEGVKIKFWNADFEKAGLPPCRSYTVYNAEQVAGIPPRLKCNQGTALLRYEKKANKGRNTKQ